MPRIKEYGPPADLLARLPTKTIVTRGDKLALLRTLSERAGATIQVGTNRIVFAAIERDIRAAHRPQKDSAPVRAGALSRTEARTEQGSSVAQACLERKITTEHADLSVQPITGMVELRIGDLGDPIALTPDQARQLAALLIEAADDVDRDTAVRKHYAQLVSTTG